MEQINVHTPSHSYPVYIGFDIYKFLEKFIPHTYSSIFIITDEHVAPLYLEEIKSHLPDRKIFTKIIHAGEQSKSIEEFYHMHSYMIESGLDRQSLIIALGGGVVGDLAGFTAATYMRGIDYIQLPTTILAHDSSVGGKVAINHENGKNMIGNFYQPRMVVYDTKTFTSLPMREFRSGYAELIKEGLIQNKSMFENILSSCLNSLNKHQVKSHIKNGIQVKASIVAKDEKESGIRKHLNLGHTLGHALEAYFGYEALTHGEAVAVGLLFSLYVSEDIFKTALPFHQLKDWLTANNYPLVFDEIKTAKIIALMKSDKKALNQSVQMVLLKQIGEPVVRQIGDRELMSYLHHFLIELGK